MPFAIVGLGPGAAEELSLRAWKILENADAIYLRTERHPCVPELPKHAQLHSFDALYEQAEDFEAVYAQITEQLLKAVETAPVDATVVYAVPGDPLVGESTTLRLLEAAQDNGIPVEIVNGISFVEPTLALLELDALDGLQILDGIDVAAMHHPPINPAYAALIGQVYSRTVASNVKLTLMNQYQDDTPVKLVHGAGTAEAIVEDLALYEIDRSDQINHMTSLYLPAMDKMTSFEQSQEIIAHLRAPEGCPWDRKQTHQSLRQYLLEETYEVLEAIDEDDPQALYEELGDLVLQILLHAQIATEAGEFYMGDVLRAINTKMIRRHPHVWGDVSVNGSADTVVVNWDAIKQQEKAEKGQERESLLDGVPKGLPALQQAYRYQKKAAKPGFDWVSAEDVLAKVYEELDEVQNAASPEEREEEVGDLLFVIVNWARKLGVADPETALRAANAKFYRRFRYIEQAAQTAGKGLDDYTLKELDGFWNEAKATGL